MRAGSCVIEQTVSGYGRKSKRLSVAAPQSRDAEDICGGIIMRETLLAAGADYSY